MDEQGMPMLPKGMTRGAFICEPHELSPFASMLSQIMEGELPAPMHRILLDAVKALEEIDRKG
jgi:hypothetical protein